MREGQFFCASLFFVILLGGLPSCVSDELNRKLIFQEASVVGQTQELIRLNQIGSEKPIDWNTALKRLNEENLSLRQARVRLDKAKKDKEDQWKSWLPSLGLQSSVLSSLTQLGALGYSDLTTSVVAPLNIPNPLTERARAFGAALSYLEAKDSYELNYRRQVVALFRIFSNVEKQLSLMSPDSSRSSEGASVSIALSQVENRAMQKQSLSALQGSLAQMLNLPGQSPMPIPSSRPVLDYSKRIHTLEPGKNYGRLAVSLSAYQLEATLLREKGVELRRWPNLSISGASPAIYNSQNSDGNSYFDLDGFSLFGGLSKAYDLTGREVDNINTARENTEFIKQNIRLRLDQDSREWIRLRARYEGLLLKKKIAVERLELIRKNKLVEFGAVELAALRSGQSALVGFNQTKEQIELELWVWDDQKWN